MLLLAAGWLWWHRRPPSVLPGVPWAYDRLLRAARSLGISTPASQTPAEMAEALQGQLGAWETRPRLAWLVHGVRPGAARLASLFVTHQYARPPADPGSSRPAVEARALWRQMRRPLWLLRWWRRLLGEKDG